MARFIWRRAANCRPICNVDVDVPISPGNILRRIERAPEFGKGRRVNHRPPAASIDYLVGGSGEGANDSSLDKPARSKLIEVERWATQHDVLTGATCAT